MIRSSVVITADTAPYRPVIAVAVWIYVHTPCSTSMSSHLS